MKNFRDKALEGGQVSLSDQKKIQILRVQMETSDPPPPLLAFAADYLKLNKREQAKLQRKTMETREEKLIPKLSKKQAWKRKVREENDGPLFGSEEEDEEDFDTMLDEKEEENEEEEEAEIEAPKPKKKKKNIKNGLDTEEQEGRKKVNTKKGKKSQRKKQKMSLKDDAEDELVDLDLSD